MKCLSWLLQSKQKHIKYYDAELLYEYLVRRGNMPNGDGPSAGEIAIKELRGIERRLRALEKVMYLVASSHPQFGNMFLHDKHFRAWFEEVTKQ